MAREDFSEEEVFWLTPTGKEPAILDVGKGSRRVEGPSENPAVGN